MKVKYLKQSLNVINVLLVSLSLIIVSFPAEAKPRKSNSHASSRVVKNRASARHLKQPRRVRLPRVAKTRRKSVRQRRRPTTKNVRTRQLRAVRTRQVRAVRTRQVRGGKGRQARQAKTFSLPNKVAPFVFTLPPIASVTPITPIALQPEGGYWSAENIALRAAEAETARIGVEQRRMSEIRARWAAEDAQRAAEVQRVVEERTGVAQTQQAAAPYAAAMQDHERFRLEQRLQEVVDRRLREQVYRPRPQVDRNATQVRNVLDRMRQQQVIDQERLRVQREQEQREQEQRAQETACLEREYEANKCIPIVGEGEHGLTVKKLLDELVQAKIKVQNILIFHMLQQASKVQIINAIDLKIENHQLEPNKADVRKALIEETVKVQCSNTLNSEERQLKARLAAEMRQPGPNEILLSEDDKKEIIARAVTLCMKGTAISFMQAINMMKSIFSVKKEFSTENDPLGWDVAEKVAAFITGSKIEDRKLAKFYYDLAADFYQTMDIGTSIEKNRELILLILQNKETNTPEKLVLGEAEEYVKTHLRAILNSPSPTIYFERLEQKRLASIYKEEVAERKQAQKYLKERIAEETQQYADIETDYFIRSLDSLYGLHERGPKLNVDYFYSDPNLVHFLDADKSLEKNITAQDMQEISNLLIQKLTVYAISHPEVDLEVSRKNITNALLTRINYCTNPVRQATMRSRMMRAYKLSTQGEKALHPDVEIATILFALEIEKNDDSRCIDGIDKWLTKFEMKNIYNAPKEKGFSILVSALMNEEKMEFLSAHKPPDTLPPYQLGHAFNPVELATEGVLYLCQRLRLAFGLPIPESEVYYRALAGTQDDTKEIYDPFNVLERFVRGGRIQYTQTATVNYQIGYQYYAYTEDVATAFVDFQPHTAEWLVKKVRQAWLDKIIPDDLLIKEIKKDWVLSKAWERVSNNEGAEDLYFKNTEVREEKYKDPVFMRLLCRSQVLKDPELVFE